MALGGIGQGFEAAGEAEGEGVAVLAEEVGGFLAAQADAAEGEDGAVAGEAGEVEGEVWPGDPAVGGEGEEGVLPGFTDVEKEVGGAGVGEAGGGEFGERGGWGEAAELGIIDGGG